MTWYSTLGFHNNPFSSKPAAFHDDLFGGEEVLESVIRNVNAGRHCFLEGEYGMGKTTVLRRIINTHKGHGNLIFYSFGRTESFDLSELLIGRSPFLAQVFGMKSKEVILLLDESHLMEESDYAQIKEHLSHFWSIVFVGKQMPKDFYGKELVEDRVYRFTSFADDGAIALVRRRIGNLGMISDTLIKEVNKASATPRMFLKNMEDIFRHTVEHGHKKVTKDILQTVLSS